MANNEHTLQVASLQLVQAQVNGEINDYICEANGEVQNVVIQLKQLPLPLVTKGPRSNMQ